MERKDGENLAAMICKTKTISRTTENIAAVAQSIE